MRRIFPAYAYGPGPRDGCWWDDTIAAPDWPRPMDVPDVDVAVVGGGFTGLSAAMHLAQAGTRVAVFEAETPGFGASGRNGGFCCLGGAKLGDGALRRIYGDQALADWTAAQSAAVDLVEGLLARHGIAADRHSQGETRLAHRRHDMQALRREADVLAAAGQDCQLIEPQDLATHGMGGPFFGALTLPKGFALNPRKYLFGLAAAAQAAGALLYQKAAVTRITPQGGNQILNIAGTGQVRAGCVLIATNGYSSEDLPEWLSGRYMPAQSTVMVTRPLTAAEISAQGWSSDQMAYDTRNLLHYFRLMPDRRMLFGMRGGLNASPRAEAAIRARLRADFDRMFPAWAGVPASHMWSGMVCLSARLMPYVGPVPGQPGLFAGLAYHGNGVAMGSYAGRLLADLALGRTPDLPYPAPLRAPMRRFPLGRFRRLLMAPSYLALHLADL